MLDLLLALLEASVVLSDEVLLDFVFLLNARYRDRLGLLLLHHLALSELELVIVIDIGLGTLDEFGLLLEKVLLGTPVLEEGLLLLCLVVLDLEVGQLG